MAEAAFNPDQYIKEKAATPAFDPDTYLKQKTAMAPHESSMLDANLPGGVTPRGLIQGTLNALPTAGMVAGGAVGTAAEPGLGSLAGAGLGAAGGEALKNLGEKYILGKDKNRSEIYGNPAKGLVEGAAAEAGGQVLGKGIEAAANTKAGQYLLDKAGKIATKLAGSFSGVPEKEIQTYAENADEINKLAKSADNDSQEMADQLRSKLNDTIQEHKQKLSNSVSAALETAPKEKNIDVTPIISKLQDYKARLDPSLNSDAIKDIDALIQKVKGSSPALADKNPLVYDAANQKFSVTQGNTTELMDELPKKLVQRLKDVSAQEKRGIFVDTVPIVEPTIRVPVPGKPNWLAEQGDTVLELPTGGKGSPKYMANIQTLQRIKQFLGDQASGAFGSTPIGFQVGKDAARAAKTAFGEAKGLMEQVGPSEIAKANAGLSRLHDIEDVMNKNMLGEGKTAASLYAAGSGGNPANAKILRQLGEETGTDMLGEAEKLAAARTFGKPSLLPVDSTGKSLTRMGVAGGAGYLLGGLPGAVIAEGAASPAAIKAAINGGIAAKNIAQATATAAPSLLGAAAESALPKSQQKNELAPIVPVADQEPSLRLNKESLPTKGPKKWATDGLQKLIDHTDDPTEKQKLIDQKGALLDDKKTRDLLISASDLNPKTKAMNQVITKVRRQLKEAE